MDAVASARQTPGRKPGGVPPKPPATIPLSVALSVLGHWFAETLRRHFGRLSWHWHSGSLETLRRPRGLLLRQRQSCDVAASHCDALVPLLGWCYVGLVWQGVARAYFLQLPCVPHLPRSVRHAQGARLKSKAQGCLFSVHGTRFVKKGTEKWEGCQQVFVATWFSWGGPSGLQKNQPLACKDLEVQVLCATPEFCVTKRSRCQEAFPVQEHLHNGTFMSRYPCRQISRRLRLPSPLRARVGFYVFLLLASCAALCPQG